MHLLTHTLPNKKIAEVLSDEVIIGTVGDGLDLLMDLYYQEFDKIILYETHITPEFFDLSSGMAGEILQKFSNYRMQLAIIGDFEKYTNKSFRDFLMESNKGGQIMFVADIAAALV